MKHLKHVLKTSSSWASLIRTPAVQQLGTNPRCPEASAFWQTDITHIPSIGHKSLYSSPLIPVPFLKNLINHVFSTFAVMGDPLHIKPDNRPAFRRHQSQNLRKTWKIIRHTGVPHDPQGQAVIEKTNTSNTLGKLNTRLPTTEHSIKPDIIHTEHVQRLRHPRRTPRCPSLESTTTYTTHSGQMEGPA